MNVKANFSLWDFQEDTGPDEIFLYKESDGDPETIIPALKDALKYAFPYPRMEIADLATAMIRAWKNGPGDIYIGDEEHPGLSDAKFEYRIEPGNSRWKVSAFEYISTKWPIQKEIVWQGHIGDDYP